MALVYLIVLSQLALSQLTLSQPTLSRPILSQAALSQVALSQVTLSTLTISGSIHDTSGGAVASATVEAVGAGRTLAVSVSDAMGRYTLDVPSGVPLQLRVRRQGFAEQAMTIPGSTRPITRDITL